MKWVIGLTILILTSGCTPTALTPSQQSQIRGRPDATENRQPHATPITETSDVVAAPGSNTESVTSSQKETWQHQAEPLTGRSHTVAVPAGGRIYVVGGLSRTGNMSVVEVYDPVSRSWKAVAELPVAVDHAMATVLEDKLYVFGGYLSYRSKASDRTFRYDPATDQWVEMARMPHPRAEGGAALLDGTVYVVGGLSPGGDSKSVMAYNVDSDQWQQVTEIPSVRGHLVVVAYRGQICAIGGQNHTQAVDCYDPATGAWGASLPEPARPVWDDAAVVVDDQIWVTGRSTQVFDGISWKPGPSPIQPRWGHGVAVIGERIYMVAGFSDRGAAGGVESLVIKPLQ